MNVSENAATKHERDAKFTEGAYHELSVLREATEEVLKRTSAAFCRQDLEEAEHIEPVEEVIDDLIAAMRANHFIRLSNGECSIYTGYIFLDMLTNLERVSDQCANIGIHTISLYLPEAAEGEHEYIHKLHHGEDEKFNSLYASYREQFFDKIHVLKKQG